MTETLLDEYGCDIDPAWGQLPAEPTLFGSPAGGEQ